MFSTCLDFFLVNLRIFYRCLEFPYPAESYWAAFKGNKWIIRLLHLKIPAISDTHCSVLPGQRDCACAVQKIHQCSINPVQTKYIGLKGLRCIAAWFDTSQKPQAVCMCATHTVCTYTFVWEMPGSTHRWQMLMFNENYCADRSLASSITCEW